MEPDHYNMNLNRNGLIGTTIFHVLIALLLIFFGFSYPDPPPEEEGILVNFGTEQTGLGNVEPAGDQVQGGVEETVPKTEPVEEPVPDVTTPKQTKSASPQVVDKQVQDYEESPVKEKKPTAEELRQQEVERQKKIQEQQRQEALRKQREEEQKKKQQAEKIQKLGENAFGNKGVGTTEGSEGITSGNGNQGSVNGTPGASNYGEGGGLGNYSYGLGNRKVRGSWPRPLIANCDVTSRIVVKVQVDVDSEGNVVGSPKVLEATYQDDCIYEAVLNAAAKAKFSVDPKSVKQRGWISYIIDPK